ncbi:MarR family transcriptional regulator [Microbacterium sp. BK668]|nr:MarR family transcriptional regulator [Microbacterium sp. BK668]
MRRIWAPVTTGRPGANRRPVDLSTVLVADALRRIPWSPSVKEIAQHLGVTQTTTSRLVARAVDAGFVVKRPAADDVRRSELALTPSGVQLSQASMSFRFSYLEQVTRGWSDAEITTFATLLQRFATEVVAHPPDPTRPREDFDPSAARSASSSTGDG